MIHQMQLDPFGYCNAACWFCPVKYHDLPKQTKTHMPKELLDKILDNVLEQKGKLVADRFNGIYTAHFNEVLLYRHLEYLFEALRKRKLGTIVLTNGTPLTPEKTNLITAYKDVVWGVCCNTPAFEKELWSKRSGISSNEFEKLLDNLSYADSVFKNNKGYFSIQINGADDYSEYMVRGDNFPDISSTEIVDQYRLACTLFPNSNVFTVPNLIDRSGLLPVSIFQNKIDRKAGPNVIGCLNGAEIGGRPNGWLHVNSIGEAFLCCNDYNYEHKFGDFKTQKLEEFWENRTSVIDHAKKTICGKCASAEWGYNKNLN